MADEEVGVEEPVRQEETDAAEKETLSVAGVTIDASQLPLFVVLIASIVLLVATTAHYDGNLSSYGNYVISVSSIAMIISFFGLLLTKFAEDQYAKVCKPMNMVLFLYTLVGACFITFKDPFTKTSNGYFAAWAVVYGSAMAIGMDAKALSTVKGIGAIMGLLASSVVVIIATITPIRNGFFKSEAVYALVLSCITVSYLLAVMALDRREMSLPKMLYAASMTILAMCWILEACFVTFRGPFEGTGNGYFASWAGALTSSFAAFAAKKAMAD
jgi:hypothetical protein